MREDGLVRVPTNKDPLIRLSQNLLDKIGMQGMT